MNRGISVMCVLAAFSSLACGGSAGSSVSYPLLSPPVKAAAPSGLGGGTAAAVADRQGTALRSAEVALGALDLSDFKQRFFVLGPTDLFRILGDVDARIKDLGAMSASAACSAQTPSKYTIHPFGESVDMYAQCYAVLTGTSAGLAQWGATPDGTFYLWVSVGAGSTAAIATPIAGATGASDYSVRIWSTVGLTNSPWDGGSYTIMHLVANGATHAFEMTAAGLGIGYCGIQIVSDGTRIYGTGSTDMGTSCLAPAEACVLAADASTASDCTAAQKAFSLPPLGRKVATGTSTTFAASLYPDTPTITLDGTTSDDVHFGPSAPTQGVGDVTIAKK